MLTKKRALHRKEEHAKKINAHSRQNAHAITISLCCVFVPV